MARFQIEKGERFALNKSEGLEKVQIDLNWKSGADLDASAFLVGADGMIMDDADFVFYNSNRRANPETGEELCKYNLKEKFSTETAVEAAKLVCNDEGEWEFEAVGEGHDGGMQTLIDIYA